MADTLLELLEAEEARDDSGLFASAAERHPSQVSLFEVRNALRTLAQQGKVSEVGPRRWALSRATDPPATVSVGVAHSPAIGAPTEAIEAAPQSSEASQAFAATREQQDVIEAPADAWLMVEAGPGTGKTAVACARVADLINRGIPAHSIVMVSFTRTAVTELRNRIRRLSRHQAGAAAIRITTLDSEAWHLGVGFGSVSKEERLKAGYSANIRDASKLLREGDAGLLEWLRDVQHVVIDEGQDLVGDRAELVFCLLDRLADEAGVTIFVDPAQAIYGFSSDIDDEQAPGASSPFHELLIKQFEVRRLQLTTLHRTSNRVLRDVFTLGRQIAMERGPARDRLDALRDIVDSNCEARARPDEDRPSNDELVLFRRRSEVLLASSFLSQKGVPHRLRLSHVELGIHPWVGAVLGQVPSSRLTEATFRESWQRLERLSIVSAMSAEEAWALLLRTAGAPGIEEVDVRALRRTLSLRRPPPEFCLTEAGLQGAVLGTIHASKGRESPRVRLMLQERVGIARDLDDEVRVDYVGATRAQESMTVGKGYAAFGLKGLNGPGGRLQRVNREKRTAMIEIGRPDDFDPISPVARAFQASQKAAQQLQSALLSYGGKQTELLAISRAESPWPYLICGEGGGTTWGALSQRVNQDLLALRFNFPEGNRLRPPEEIPHLYLFGVRTVVLAEGDPQLSSVHEPWASSGVFLAPVVKALTTVRFRLRRFRSFYK